MRILRTALLGALEERAWLLSMPVVVGGVTALLAPSYADTYATAEDRARAVAISRANETMSFLYGKLPEESGVVQLAVWELGALTCLLVGIVVVLRAVARSRGQEDAGRSETLRAAGVGPGGELAATTIVLALECLLLGCGAGVGLLRLDDVGATDAAAYGAALGATWLLLATTTLLVSQMFDDAPAARGAGLAVMALLFAGHGAWAAKGWDWAGGWSPFRLRSAVDPGDDNDWTPVAVALGAALAVLLVAGAAARERDLGAALVRPPRLPARPLRVRGPLGLSLRLSRLRGLAWAVATATITGALVAMGENIVDLARQGGVDGGSLGSVLGNEDPGTGFLGYIGMLVGALAAAQAVATTGRFSADEHTGRLELQRSTGPGAGRLLASWWAAAAADTAVTLALSGVVAGFVGAEALDTGADDAVRLVGGQWPATAAAAGLTALLCGAWPRGRVLAWLPVLAGLGIAQLGDVLDLPQRVTDAGPFAQAGERGSLWLVAVGAVGLALGMASAWRRDLAVATGVHEHGHGVRRRTRQ